MNKKLDNIKNFRVFLLKQIGDLSTDQLNAIPEGYNNNIIWNLAHLVSTTQALCYKRSGLAVTIEDKYFAPFLTGTKPERFIDSDEIEVIKESLLSSIGRLQTDFENKEMFNNYTKSVRIAEVYGIDVSTIDDAIEFLTYHEGLHSGQILGLKKLVM